MAYLLISHLSLPPGKQRSYRRTSDDHQGSLPALLLKAGLILILPSKMKTYAVSWTEFNRRRETYLGKVGFQEEGN